MDATPKETGLSDEVRAELETLGSEAREAARQLALATAEDKDRALRMMAEHIRKDCDDLLQANKRDVENAIEDERPEAFIDRLTLTPDRRPIVGPISEIPGLYVATGFSGNDFQLAPSIGEGVRRTAKKA